MFNDRSNVFTSPRAHVGAASALTTLRCTGCGLHVARVRDTRFGSLPLESFCLACSARMAAAAKPLSVWAAG